MWQGLILLPIAIIAQWLAQPESPAADPNTIWCAADLRFTDGSLVWLEYLGWIMSLTFFSQGPHK